MPDLSIIIPACNEATRLMSTADAYATEFASDAEVIVVVNGSSDDTGDVARIVAARHANVKVLETSNQIGKGGAIRLGFQEATGTYLGFVDADMATQPSEYRKLVVAAKGCGVAIASRWAPGAIVINRSGPRMVASRAFAWLTQTLLQLPFYDTQCGAKVLHRSYLSGYLAKATVSNLAFDVELLLLLHRQGAKVAEVPTTWVSIPGSETLGSPLAFMRHGMLMSSALLALYWNRQRDKPDQECA